MQAIAVICTTRGQLAFLYKLKHDMKLSLDSDGEEKKHSYAAFAAEVSDRRRVLCGTLSCAL